MLEALRHANFRMYWFSALGNSFAQGMQFLILGWIVLEITNSASQLGFVIFLYGLPNLLTLVFGGVVADRFDRKWLLTITQFFSFLIILILSGLIMLGMVTMWHVYAASFSLGIIQGINMPSRMAIVGDLVNRSEIMNAVALNMVVMNTGRSVGPAIAGWIIDIAGTGHAMLLNALCYLIGTLFMLLITGLQSTKAPSNSNVVKDLVEGIKFFAATPIVFTIVGIGFAFGFFAAAYMGVIPAFAKQVLGLSAGGAGILLSASGVGSFIGNVILANIRSHHYLKWLLLGSALLFSFTLLLFAWSVWFYVSWLVLVLVGMGSMSYVAVGTTILQLSTPIELRGRVMSLWLIGAALNFVGALPLGVLADLTYWPVSITSGAIAFLIVVIVMGVWRPTVRKLQL